MNQGEAIAGGGLSADELRDRVDSIPVWYHTFQFPGGVVTEGFFDHTKVLPKLPIPDSLEGKRCLDIASSDGFFALTMAERGGEVVSVDMEDATAHDWQRSAGPPPEGITSGARERFELAREAKGVAVERVDCNVYDVSRENLGEFDFVFIGNILLHLSDPFRALLGARSVTRGQLLSFETISLTMSLLRPRTASAVLYEHDDARWWTPNARGHRRLLASAGFEIEDSHFPMLQPFGKGFKKRYPAFRRKDPHSLGTRLAFAAFNRPFGVPSQWALCS